MTNTINNKWDPTMWFQSYAHGFYGSDKLFL